MLGRVQNARMARRVNWLCAMCAIASACKPEPNPQEPAATTVGSVVVSSAVPTTSVVAGQRHSIAAGEVLGGTHPEAFSRDPALEPLPFRAKLGPFEIDAFPYPNDPLRSPELVNDAAAAEQYCAKAGGRLCTELEWERACRGPNQQPYAGTTEPNPACADPVRCVSEFGVYGLGSRLEWTASKLATGAAGRGESVLKGALADETSSKNRRCSRRMVPSKETSQAAFRCCYGPPNAARVPEPKEYPAFERPTLTADFITRLLQSHERTRGLAKEWVRFSDPEAANTVISRGPGDRKGFSFTAEPLLWSPTTGLRFLLIAAKSGDRQSFVLAYHALGNDQYALASSFVLDNEKGPVVFAYSPSIRPRVHFSTCWGCPGETGKVLFRKPDRAVILQP